MVALRDGVAPEVILSLETVQTTVLVVRNPDGSPPSGIGILSVSDGVIGPFISVSCSAGGRCELTELPAGHWTLLVMGAGVALVEVDAPSDEVPIALRRPGEIALKVVADDVGVAWKVRLSDAATGIVLPVFGWMNAGRGEWAPVPASGLTLGLPEGPWRIEAVAPDGTQSIRQVAVPGGGEITVELE
ncbi:MAG: hypothetical protein ACC742_06340 [Thermoanaerobaculales bacterium]